MRKSLWLLALLPCLAMAQMTVGVWTLTPGSVAPGGGGGGGGTPGGNDGDWQINSGGSFGGVTPASGWDTLFVTPSSANLAAWITDETGTAGSVVFSTGPTIAAPTLTGTTTASTVATTTLTATTFTFNSVSVTGPTGTGNMVLATAPTISSIELGSTATTLTGSGGVLSVEGVVIPSVSSTNTLTAKTLQLSGALGTDDTLEGITVSGLTAGATIAQWEAVYVGGSSTYLLADANGSSTYPARGLAVAAYSSTNAAIIITRGTVRNDAWNWTPGGTIYLSGTPGALTQTAPSTSGDKVQAIGYALTADIAFFDFDSTYVTVQ